MARKGNFGRQPRSAPSITATIISIAREQQSREDQNIMDAWQKGGIVGGVEVTDEMVLKHWRQRLVDISEDDPLYDTYSNSVLQLEYSIAQSKMTAQYALIVEPSSGDNMKMANFFLNWAKKVPKNSEFYRVLQRDAGQYLRAAKQKKVTQERDRSAEIYRAQMTALEKKNERTGQTALRVITMLAQQGTVIGENPLGNIRDIANRSNLGTIQIGGVEQLLGLLGTVMNDAEGVMVGGQYVQTQKGGASAQVLYTDENGQQVTGQSLVAQFKALDPTFSGNFNLAYVQGAIVSARDGIKQRIALAEKNGYIAEASSLSLEMAKLTEFGRQVDAYPVASEYNELREQMAAAVSSNALLPDAKVARIEALRAEMGKLAADPRIAEDTRMQTQLRAEAEGKVGVPTLGEDLDGDAIGYADNIKENDIVNRELELFKQQKDAVDAGQMVYTQGVYMDDPITGKRKFVAQTNGPMVGAALMSDINNLPGAGKPVPVMVPNGDGGGATPMYVVPAPIQVSAKNPDGTPMSGTNANPAGSFISYMVNGKPVTLYSITRNGTAQWTTDPPWDASMVKTSQNNGVMTVELQSTPTVDPLALNVNGAIPGAAGFMVAGASQNEDGTFNPGRVVYDPQVVVTMTDPSRVYAGPDPFTDSFSASLAAVKASPDGDKLLAQWTGDARFNFILDHNARIGAGQTFNPATGLWDGGDPAAYAKNLSAMKTDLAVAGGQRGGGGSWQRDAIDLAPDSVKPVVNAASAAPPGGFFSYNTATGATLLPSSVIQQQPEARFKALGFNYVPGTNQFKNPGKVADDRLTLTTGLNLKVPSVAPFMTAPAPAPAPAVVAPIVTSSSPYTPPAYTPTTPYQGSGGSGGGSGNGGYGNGLTPQ